jgi:anti-anti-sigma factor
VAIGRGELETPLPHGRGGEIGALTTAFSQMTHSLRERIAAEQAAHAQALRLQQEIIHLQEANLRELSVPLIPLMHQALLLPLIGAIDTARAAHLLETLLDGVAQQRARLVLLDLSGVRMVDTRVAQTLLQAAQAVRLLGAEVALIGIRAAVAQEIIATGVEVGDMPVYANLATAIMTLVPSHGEQPDGRS